MSSTCQQIIEAFGSRLGLSDVARAPWYMIAGRAGPQAVLKLTIPPWRSMDGYVLTVARHADACVISREVHTLRRLCEALPDAMCVSIPTVLAHDRTAWGEYFAVPFYDSCGHGRLTKRLARRRRFRWVEQWLTDLASHTVDGTLTSECVEADFGEALCRLQGDSRVHDDVKIRVAKSFETVRQRGSQIPTVCCHGDLWVENLLWQRGVLSAVVLDWGAARWPGLPCVDLCRYALSTACSQECSVSAISRYCSAVGLDPSLVPALYDVYNLFVKAESDVASATQPNAQFDPFLEAGHGQFHGLASLLSARREA